MTFKASLQFLNIKEGGLKTALHTDCRLKLVFEDANEVYYNAISQFIDVNLVLPGEHTTAFITIAKNQPFPNALYAGMSFKVFELTKYIGSGTIIHLRNA